MAVTGPSTDIRGMCDSLQFNCRKYVLRHTIVFKNDSFLQNRFATKLSTPIVNESHFNIVLSVNNK